MATALANCGNYDWESSQQLFRKPLDLFGRHAGGYTYSDLGESKLEQPIGPDDLIDASGSCPAAAAAPPQAQSAADTSGASPPPPSDVLGEGVGLGMSECEVVRRAGEPSNVQLGSKPNGDRSAVLTFLSGPRPGIYRFERGRLVEIDRVDQPAPPPKVAKKKPAKPKTANGARAAASKAVD